MFILETLRSVEIKTAVNLPEWDFLDDTEAAIFKISLDLHERALMDICVVHTLLFNSLGTADQAEGAVEEKEIRALPHITERMGGLNPAEIRPVGEIF